MSLADEQWGWGGGGGNGRGTGKRVPMLTVVGLINTEYTGARTLGSYS